jgi:hypothetical protein
VNGIRYFNRVSSPLAIGSVTCVETVPSNVTNAALEVSCH